MESKSGIASFVPNSMISAGTTMLQQFGKIIQLQQKVLRDHAYQTLLGLDEMSLKQVQQKILQVPGIISINRTTQYITQGRYRLLTQSNLPQSRLQTIDDILAKINPDPRVILPNGRPRRSSRPDEKIPDGLKQAWHNQTQGISPSPINAWSKPVHAPIQMPPIPMTLPPYIHPSMPAHYTPTTMSPPPNIHPFPKLAPKGHEDDKSTTTTNTITIDLDEHNQMQDSIKSLTAQSKRQDQHQKKQDQQLNQLTTNFKKMADNNQINNSKIKKGSQNTAEVVHEVTQMKQQVTDLNHNIDMIREGQHINTTQIDHIDTRQSIMENNYQGLVTEIRHSHGEMTTELKNANNETASLRKMMEHMIRLYHQPSHQPPQECYTSGKSGVISALTGDSQPRHPTIRALKYDENDTSTAPSTYNSQHETGTHTQETTMDITADDPATNL